MGNYNPHTPQILGQEWCGIRDESVVLSPVINIAEIGHQFTLDTDRQVSIGAYYVKEQPPSPASNQVSMVTVYAAGTEATSGPVRRVVIPVNSAPATGSGINPSTNASRVQSVLSPSDTGISVQPYTASGQKSIAFFFNTSAYAQLLNDKRILAVNLLYTLSWEPEESGTTVTAVKDMVYSPSQNLSMKAGSGSVRTISLAPFRDTFGNGLLYLPGLIVGTIGDGSEVATFGLGEVNPLSNTPPATTTQEQWPWRYTELARFEETAGINRTWIQFDFGDTNALGVYTGDMTLGYLAMEVLFCEETRLLIGGIKKTGAVTSDYVLGHNQVTMRDTSLNLNPILAAGEYTVAVEMPDIGDLPGAVITLGQKFAKDNAYPKLNGLRQLYAIPGAQGVQVNLTRTVGEQFSSEETFVLPQLSLHASGGAPLTEVHAYGVQAHAQVYGTISATQEIFDSVAGGAQSYPWVRFYARRFGDTSVPLLLDSPTIAGSSVDITPGEFDELDEIVDGWKEVTLRFDTPPSMGTGTNPTWRWTAAGEGSGNRWEVLGVTAPALSGIPGNLLNLVPAAYRLPTATYGAPSAGDTINMAWVPQYAPPVSAVADDSTTDAVLFFGQDLPSVTGFSSSLGSQELTGIGLDCGLDPCCIPTALDYVELTWGLPANSGVGSDTFDRVEAAGGWGTADVGGAYGLVGTAADFSVDDEGLITFSANNSSRFAVLNTGSINFDITTDVTSRDSVLTGTMRGGAAGRFTSNQNNYVAAVDITSTGTVSLTVEKRVGGVLTTLVTRTILGLSGGAGATLTVRFVGYGTFLKAKVWNTQVPQPASWDIETTDSSLVTGSEAGIFGRDESAVTGHILAFDNLVIQPVGYIFGYYELQRMDAVSTDWQTIMKATNPATTGFNDYEARVGILSSYRIRAVDVYDFPGEWSDTVTATVPEPGVTIGCTGGHLLIFTSNEEQDGSVNLAYSSVWESQVEENFAFAESRFVELQAMYNRDFFVAFRPTERGGEQFSRTVLVQAAAIDPETLADFTSLRDMAWADVSYICVRDEDGNRWFATVLVPGGRVVHNRTLYTAPVEIIEVTDTPSEVDP